MRLTAEKIATVQYVLPEHVISGNSSTVDLSSTAGSH